MKLFITILILLIAISSTNALLCCNDRGLCNGLLGTCVCKDLSPLNSLEPDQSLLPGSSLISSNGLFKAEMRTDGTFIVLGADGKNFTRTAPPGSSLLFTSSGALSLAGNILTGLLGSLLNLNPKLVLRNNGELAIYTQPILGNVEWKWGSDTGTSTPPTSDDYLYGGSSCSIAKCGGLLPGDSGVCNNQGTCNVLGQCVCNSGYLGGLCNLLSCAGIAQDNITNVCSGKGSCIGVDLCQCQSGFLGSTCEAFQCFGKFMNDTNVCNLGSCLGPDLCQCPLGYFGLDCSIPKCFGLLSNETGVCGGKGSCISPDTCLCNNGVFGELCDKFKCFDKLSNETNVCGFGQCIGTDICDCLPGYSGTKCDAFQCFGKFMNDTNVCNFGSCSGPDLCQCPLEKFGLDCSLSKCFGILSNETDVCGGKGSCIGLDTCLCNNGVFGELCDKFKCFGKLSNETNVCGFGQCIGTDLCSCLPGYGGEKCDLLKCGDFLANDTQVCNGLGLCSLPGKCLCNNQTGILGDLCNVFDCFGKLSNESGVCGLGLCISPNFCECPVGVLGLDCNYFKCGSFWNNETGVCSSKGICIGIDSCQCMEGYGGQLCQDFSCFGMTTGACSNQGVCIAPNQCLCNDNYFGSFCNITTCFSKWSNSSNQQEICSGRGQCIGFDVCQCQDGFDGPLCEVDMRMFGIQLNTSQDLNILWNDKTGVNILFSTLPDLIIEPPVSTPRLRFALNCLTNCVGGDSMLILSHTINQSTGQFNILLNTSYLLDLGINNFEFRVKAYYANNAPYAERFSNYLYFSIRISGSFYNLRSMGLPQYLIKSSLQPIEIVKVDSTIYGMYLDRITYLNLLKSVCTWNSCSLPLNQSLQFNFLVEEQRTNNFTILNQYGDLFINKIQPIINKNGDTVVELTFNNKNIEILRDLTLYQDTQQFNIKLNISNSDGMSLDSWMKSIPVYTFSIPSGPLFQVSPTRGMALDQLFNIQIKPWTVTEGSGIELQFAIGFRDGLINVRLTEFNSSTDFFTFLPFVRQFDSSNEQSRLDLVLFVKDSIGNVKTFLEISQQVEVTAFNRNVEELLEKLSNIGVASYDESFLFFSSISDKRQFIRGVLNSGLEIDLLDPSFSLVRLQRLSQNQTLLDEDIVSTVARKVESFVNSTSSSYLNEKMLLGRVLNRLSNDNLNSTLTVTSNIMSSKLNYRNSIAVTEGLASMILLGEETLPVSNNFSLPVVDYSLPSFTISVSSFRLESQSNTSMFSYKNSIHLNLNNILSSYNGFSKDSGVSLIVYNESPVSKGNSTQISHIKNFKFFIDNSLTILENLNEPITLTFPIKVDQNTTGFNLSCKYLDEIENLWKTDGCYLAGSDSSNIYCACTHTTMFSTFMERITTTTISPGNQIDSNVALLLAQIAFGAIFSIISIVCLVYITIYRKKQPIASRFVTPYLGLIALLIECVLAFIVQRSILVNNLFETNATTKNNNDYAANIVANVVTIIVNTINLTAILSYLLQVCRFQVSKYLYNILRSRTDQNMENHIKKIRIITSNKLFTTLLVIFALLNVIYWTVLVILVRTGVLTGEVYTYIVSISYSTIIITLGICISAVIAFDGISYLTIEKKRRSLISLAMNRIKSNVGSSSGDGKSEFFLVRLKDWFTSLDSPLYFRSEMMCFLISFVFLLTNQIIGLSTLSLRNLSNSSQTPISNTSIDTSLIVTDSIIFVSEILYAIWYVLVFGGLVSIIFTKNNLQSQLRRRLLKKKEGTKVELEENSKLNEDMELVFGDNNGSNLFEIHCIKEMASENLYLFKELQKSDNLTNSSTISVLDLCSFLTTVRNVYIVSGSSCEVNISAKCRKEFELFYARVERMKKSEINEIFNSNSSSPHISGNNKKYVLNSWLHKSLKESSHHSISSETSLVGSSSPKSNSLTDSNVELLKGEEVLTSKQVFEGIESLKQEIIINLGDTFSRFIFTKEYKLWQQSSLQQTQLMERNNLI